MADDKEKQQATEHTVSFSLKDIYYEDEFVYPEYIECEALKTVDPVEAELTEKEENPTEASQHTALPKADKAHVFNFADALSFCTDAVYTVGDNTINLIKRLISKIGPFLLVPFAIVFTLISSLFNKLKHLILYLPKKIKKELSDIVLQSEKHTNLFKAFFIYAFKGKKLYRAAFNLAFPILALIFVMNVYGDIKDTVFALEVIYNGKSIGYVEDEDVFAQGKKQALRLLSSGQQENESEIPVSEPVYKVRRVEVNQLSNPGMISENIIASSETAYIRACGIYIDGEFLCAVKNESDALSVFEGILEPYVKKSGSTESVAFVEEIEYVQGLYPEDSELIWSPVELKKVLSEPKAKAVYHTFKEGDTVKKVASKYRLTTAKLKALNPKTDFSKPEQIKKLLVSRQENYVRVKVMRTRTKELSIPFETVKRNSSSLAKGTSKTTQQGAKGIKTVTELVTYIDGVASYTTTISEKITKAPVNKIVLVGTKTYTAASSGYTWPTRGAYAISSYYGYRSASISGWSYHGGIDIVRSGGGTSGTPVVAAASGTVEIARSGYSGYGHTVVINHGNGIKTRYAHMYPGSITVRVGQKVSKGQQIGRIGSTGNSTGPHLHFEVLVNGSKVNPLKYIR